MNIIGCNFLVPILINKICHKREYLAFTNQDKDRQKAFESISLKYIIKTVDTYNIQ
jgi:hypothetical protein